MNNKEQVKAMAEKLAKLAASEMHKQTPNQVNTWEDEPEEDKQVFIDYMLPLAQFVLSEKAEAYEKGYIQAASDRKDGYWQFHINELLTGVGYLKQPENAKD